MEIARPVPGVMRFGVFELDPVAGELRKAGLRIRLPEQSLKILVLLLERPGTVVTREELRHELWPDGTFVEFDHSLNAAINRLRTALGDSADNPRFVETLSHRGYRFIATVGDSPVPAETELSPRTARARETEGRKLWLRTVVMTGFLAVLVLTLLFALNVRGWQERLLGTRSQPIRSIAVLPMENLSRDPEQEYFADGMTDELITSLAQISALRVISRASVLGYKSKHVPIMLIARELNVDAVVEGTVSRSGDRVRITAQLIDAKTDRHLWAQTYERDLRDVLALQDEVAKAIANEIEIKLTPQEQLRLASDRKKGTQDPDAHDLYLKGRYYWNKRTPPDLETAISYFNQAIAKDPGYALAYSGLADAYSILSSYGGTPSENYPKSNAAARKALELDSSLAHPHAVLGVSEMVYEWDFAGGEAEFKKTFELDPNDATAHQWHATIIAGFGGREQEALAEINLAHQLDPLSPIISVNTGDVHAAARQYDEAIVICKKVANENPAFAAAHDCLEGAYWGKREYAQVIEELKICGQLSGNRNASDFASAMEQGFRSAGWKGALTKGIEIRQAHRQSGYSSAYAIARLYADLGDKNQAFLWLNTAYQERNDDLRSLKSDFLLDPLRSDPRFAELVHKVGLPQ
jgi:TolB-like protein/DNA-binding winged helix-turn-helix (wHTH) protein